MKTPRTLLFVFGTRPEAIKMAPLIRLFRAQPDSFRVRVCVTAQHRDMLDQVLEFFAIRPDTDLNLMKPGQTLSDVTSGVLKGLEPLLASDKPDLVLVQGDTTTAFAGALAAFYARVRVAHIEAGLRSSDRYSPFPEEINRVLVGRLADIHFAPTDTAALNLKNEGISENVHVVGNTGIDALGVGLELLAKSDRGRRAEALFPFLKHDDSVVLVTMHRRESFGAPLQSICDALKVIAGIAPNIRLVYPVHPNPSVREPVWARLGKVPNIHLLNPLDYPDFLWLMNRAHILLTDSGGIQEEAPSLGKPVLVLRDVTERVEGLKAGTAKLVGTDKEVIVREAGELLKNAAAYQRMAMAVNPYGDGRTSERIAGILKKAFE